MKWIHYSSQRPLDKQWIYECCEAGIGEAAYVGRKQHKEYLNAYLVHTDPNDKSLKNYWLPCDEMILPNQPERSKREDSQECEMRCSEHCGNTLRDK